MGRRPADAMPTRRWDRARQALEALLDLPPEVRAQRLAALRSRDPELAVLLDELFAAERAAGKEFLPPDPPEEGGGTGR